MPVALPLPEGLFRSIASILCIYMYAIVFVALSSFQIIRCFDFSKCIASAMHLDIVYISKYIAKEMYLYLMSNARKKVMTRMELHMADATVVEVYLRLTLDRFRLSVFLQIPRNQFSSFFQNQNKRPRPSSCCLYSPRLDRQNYLY
jgi:hypothetical protein